jgi:hypothetical protein
MGAAVFWGLAAGNWWLVAGGWWLVAGGWWLVMERYARGPILGNKLLDSHRLQQYT